MAVFEADINGQFLANIHGQYGRRGGFCRRSHWLSIPLRGCGWRNPSLPVAQRLHVAGGAHRLGWRRIVPRVLGHPGTMWIRFQQIERVILIERTTHRLRGGIV